VGPGNAVFVWETFICFRSNYREKEDFNMAIKMYKKALTLDPEMVSVRENLERPEQL